MSSPKYGARNPFLAETLSRYSDAFSENPRGTVTFRRVFEGDYQRVFTRLSLAGDSGLTKGRAKASPPDLSLRRRQPKRAMVFGTCGFL